MELREEPKQKAAAKGRKNAKFITKITNTFTNNMKQVEFNGLDVYNAAYCVIFDAIKVQTMFTELII